MEAEELWDSQKEGLGKGMHRKEKRRNKWGRRGIVEELEERVREEMHWE